MAPGDDDDALAAEWDAALEESEGDGEGGDSDELAAEWEAMMEGGDDGDGEGDGEAPAREATRVLNQDEIDSLLGFDEEGDEAGERAGIQAIPVSYTHLTLPTILRV